jgi:DNA-binding NtrC family response regulator
MEPLQRLLVVEDDPVLQAIYSDMFSKNYDMTLAKDGMEGWEIFQKESGFPVVLSDISMPRLNGIELGRKVLKFNPETQIIFVTAMLDDETAILAMTMNAYCVPKPVEPLYIKIALSKAFENNRLAIQRRKLKPALTLMQKLIDEQESDLDEA